MKKIKILFPLFAAIIVLLNSCDEVPTAFQYQKIAVVEGTLVAGESIDTLRLNWTGEVDKFYNRASLAIPNAVVLIKNSDGSIFDSLIYDSSNPGRYYSVNPSKKAEPKKSYSLYIKTPFPDERIITGSTTVPDTFSIIYSSVKNNDTLHYDLNAPPNIFLWSPSSNFGTYLPTVESLDSGAALIPKFYYSDTAKSDFIKPDKIAFRIGLPREQTNTLMPWIFLSYYGKNSFDVYAVDDNLMNFINQAVIAQSDELKDITYALSGGIGYFGAKTKAKNGIVAYIVP
ncbi:MAG: hypothetical protein H3C35_05405 [Bacteroidetes bacterium]|nr:hypothetical protein [Bacteroidota bacterium]